MGEPTRGETALVTGAAGFIGSHLSVGLLDRGYRVIGVDNFESGSPGTVAELRSRDRFSFAEGDVRDASFVSGLFDRADALFHHAAITSVGRSYEDPRATADVNCTGTAVLLSEARNTSLANVVVASSASVYGSGTSQPVSEDASLDPESPYATSKLWTERLAMQLEDHVDGDVVALRYFNVYGPGQDPNGAYASVVPSFVSRVRRGSPPIIYGDGEQTRDFVHVGDVVRANAAVADAEASGEIYNVGSGERTSINELAETCLDIADVDVDVKHEPPREGDVRHSCADVSKIRNEIGFEPTIDLREGLESLVHDGVLSRSEPGD